ncbi:hypothetical protein EDD85DRAFT_795066 [Armillaria nabsnona]|nr:hypothetical protein EDD85DRAFT_795066 [Armillaria nabsnona]
MPMNENHEDVKLVVGEEVALRNLVPVTFGLSLSYQGSSFIVVRSRISVTLYGAYRLCPRRYGQECYDTGSMTAVMSFELTPPGSAVPTHFTRATITDIFITFSAKTLGVLCASHLRIIGKSNNKHQWVMNSSDQPFIVLLDRSSNPSRQSASTDTYFLNEFPVFLTVVGHYPEPAYMIGLLHWYTDGRQIKDGSVIACKQGKYIVHLSSRWLPIDVAIQIRKTFGISFEVNASIIHHFEMVAMVRREVVLTWFRVGQAEIGDFSITAQVISGYKHVNKKSLLEPLRPADQRYAYLGCKQSYMPMGVKSKTNPSLLARKVKHIAQVVLRDGDFRLMVLSGAYNEFWVPISDGRFTVGVPRFGVAESRAKGHPVIQRYRLDSKGKRSPVSVKDGRISDGVGIMHAYRVADGATIPIRSERK